MIGALDESPLIHGNNGGRTGLHQNAQSFFGLARQLTVADQFCNEQAASGQGQRFETQPDECLSWIERAEKFAERGTEKRQHHDGPPRQKTRGEHDWKQVEKAKGDVRFGAPIHQRYTDQHRAAQQQNAGPIPFFPESRYGK